MSLSWSAGKIIIYTEGKRRREREWREKWNHKSHRILEPQSQKGREAVLSLPFSLFLLIGKLRPRDQKELS